MGNDFAKLNENITGKGLILFSFILSFSFDFSTDFGVKVNICLFKFK